MNTCEDLNIKLCPPCSENSSKDICWVDSWKNLLSRTTAFEGMIVCPTTWGRIVYWLKYTHRYPNETSRCVVHFDAAVKLYHPEYLERFRKLLILI
jgi:hypothetical protein